MPNVTGLRGLLADLRAAKAAHKEDVTAALHMAGLYIQRESQDRVPVEYGLLKQSADTILIEQDGVHFCRVVVGYKAAYALWVHESEAKYKGKNIERPSGLGPYYWDPSPKAGPKFLESVPRDKREEIRRIIRGRALGQD